MTWNIVMHYLFAFLASKLGWQCVLDHVTLYADDIHLAWLFRTQPKFDKVPVELKLVLDHFQSHGFHISLSKSAILMRYIGTYSKHFR